MQIIGLTGYAGSGKDTVRGILEDAGFIGLAFADPIRTMLRELLTSNGIGDCYMDDRVLKESVIPELGVSYRHMAQTLGTEWGRALHGDFWLNIAGAYIDDQANEQGESHFVISDVRFRNEAQWVRDRGGMVWHIDRIDAAPVRDHVSESEIDRIAYDNVIFNNGTFDELKDQVERVIRAMA
jgi:hypothetical protein